MQTEYGCLIIISECNKVLSYGRIGRPSAFHEWDMTYSYILVTSVDSGESIDHIKIVTMVRSYKDVGLSLNR